MLLNNYTRILLVRVSSPVIKDIGFPRAYRPHFTLKYMEALLKEENYLVGFIDSLISPHATDGLAESSLKFDPQVIIAAVTTVDSEYFLEYARLLKEKNNNLVIIAIGQDATWRPEKYRYLGSPVDMVLPGEPEAELLKILKALNKGGYPKNRQIETPLLVEDLDALPFPKYSRGELRKYSFLYPLRMKKALRWGHILSSRGCPYKCIFCSQVIRESYGEKVRLRTPGNVVDEIEQLINSGANIIAFDDDNFTTSKAHVSSICDEILSRGIRIKWIAHARVDNLNFELLEKMKNAGCTLLRFGIESGSERILKILNKTDDADNWVRKSKEVFKIAKKLGIDTVALFIIGNPSESREEIGESIALAKDLDPDILQVSFFTPYPGSEAFDKFGSFVKTMEKNLSMYHYFSCGNYTSNLNQKELSLMHRNFYKDFIFRPDFLIRHFLKYKFFYLYNSDILCRISGIMKYFRRQHRHFVISGI